MSMSNNDTVFTSGTASPAQFHLGFQRVEQEIRAVPEQDLEPINLDVPTVIATVLGALPEIQALREPISKLPLFDMDRFDKLQDYALALGHAHALHRAAAGSADAIGEIATTASDIRDRLQADATALAFHGLLNRERAANLRNGTSYKNIAFDVIGLVELFLERWDDIKDKTAVRREHIDEARLIANRLIAAIGLREQGPAVVGGAALLRQQAFTLFLRAYDEARRAVAFVRWHTNDGDSIAPSLYAGRGTGRRSTETTPTATAPGTATEQGPLDPAPATAPATANSEASSAIPVGLPGSSPFMKE